jgi:hypothetical protein
VLKLVENEETRDKGLSLLFGAIKIIVKAPGMTAIHCFVC